MRTKFSGLLFAVISLIVHFNLFLQPLQAQELRIATVERPPFVMEKGGKLTGFSIELFDAVALQLGREVRYVMAPNDSFSAMLEAVKKRDVDGAIANISITSAREEQMDFSKSIYDSGLRIMTPATKGNPGLGSFGKAIWDSGLIQVLGLAFGVLIIAAHIMWLIERGNSTIRKPYIPGIWDAFWWCLVIVTMGGFEDQQPNKIAAKAFAVFWIFSSLFITSIFIAKITSAFTLQQLQSNIQSYRDLAGKKVGVTKGSTAEKFLEGEDISTVPFAKLDELFKQVKLGKLDAVVHDQPLVRYFASHSGRGRVQLVGNVFKKEKYGIALQTQSPLQEEIDRIILRLKENGTHDTLLKKYFGE